MKKIGYAFLGVLVVVICLYWFRQAHPEYMISTEELSSGPVAVIQETSLEVGKTIHVIAAGYPLNTKFHYTWSVGDRVIENDSPDYTPTEEDLENFITVTVCPENPEYETVTARVYFSRLPVFYLDTESGAAIESKEYYINATLKVQGNEQYTEAEQLYNGSIQIKGRGNSTWRTSNKKPYNFKLESDSDLLGLGTGSSWSLLANAFDSTLMRNALSYNLSGQLGLCYMQSTWVSMVMNGQYIGNYQLCEKIEISPERIDITDWEELASEAARLIVRSGAVPKNEKEALKKQLKQDLSWLTTGEIEYQGSIYQIPRGLQIPSRTGGFMMELDMFYDEISQFTVGNQQFMFKEPKYAVTNPELFEYTREYVQAFYVAAASSKDFYTVYQGKEVHYSDLFDMDSLVAFYLIQEIFFNEDGNAKSSYFYKDVDGKAYMGPVWDMDWSSAGMGEDASLYDQWQTTFYSKYNQNQQWYKGLVRDPYFLSIAKKYWDTYHDVIFDMVAEGGAIDQMYQYLYESGTVNGELWPWRGNDFTQEVEILKTWLTNRLNWLDEQFASLTTLVDSIGSFEYGVPTQVTRVGRVVMVDCEIEEERYPYVVFYVDGRKYDSIVLQKGKAFWTMPEDTVLEPESVIQIRIYDSDGLLIGSNYIDNREP